MKVELEFSRNTAYENLRSPDDRTFKVTLTEGDTSKEIKIKGE